MDLRLKGLNEDTPLELYHIKGREVWVKRDDLMGDGMSLPPWGKLAALFELVKKYIDKSKPLVHLSVDGSWTAWALGAICEELGIEFYAAHPDSKKISQEYLGMIKEMYPKTNLYPIRPNMMQIMYNSLKKDAREKGWQMLPYAFDHDFYKDYLAERIQPYTHFDNLVVSSGSGVTLSGLAKGYYREELKEFFPQVKRKIWTTCVSSVSSINKTLKKSGIPIPLNIRKSEYLFENRLDGYETPFPCNQFWDVKQWKWLEENIDQIEGTILFWNIGGIYKF
jgi:1-aminocyclopropane-1-carboxylate deaminase/D-cysteine desulfhydrase-like pyridoxal-dependent ACC family enzyme